jgi:hypothetical protein
MYSFLYKEEYLALADRKWQKAGKITQLEIN